MAKRFTDTTKWDDPWFTGLSPKHKLLWVFICDRCDAVGVWKINLDLASFLIGDAITATDLLETLKGRVVLLSDELLWIPKFISFQYKTLKANNKAHLGMMKQIVDLTRDLPLDASSQELIDSFSTLIRGSAEGQSTLQVKVKEKVILEGGVGETNFDFDSLYAVYPRKEGKDGGMTRLRERIKTPEQYDAFARAVRKYAHKCKMARKEEQYIKLWSSFVGTPGNEPWRDFAEPEKPRPVPVHAPPPATPSEPEMTAEQRAEAAAKLRGMFAVKGLK